MAEEYWVNVYNFPDNGFKQHFIRWDCKELAIFHAAKSILYRIHVKMKPSNKVKYEQLKYFLRSNKFNWID